MTLRANYGGRPVEVHLVIGDRSEGATAFFGQEHVSNWPRNYLIWADDFQEAFEILQEKLLEDVDRSDPDNWGIGEFHVHEHPFIVTEEIWYEDKVWSLEHTIGEKTEGANAYFCNIGWECESINVLVWEDSPEEAVELANDWINQHAETTEIIFSGTAKVWETPVDLTKEVTDMDPVPISICTPPTPFSPKDATLAFEDFCAVCENDGNCECDDPCNFCDMVPVKDGKKEPSEFSREMTR